APEVNAQRPLPIRRRLLPECTTAGDTSVVAQHVHVPVCLDSLRVKILNGPELAHVSLDGEDVTATFEQGFLGLLEGRNLDISQHDAHLGVHEASREREADAAGGARHYGCFALELLHALI